MMTVGDIVRRIGTLRFKRVTMVVSSTCDSLMLEDLRATEREVNQYLKYFAAPFECS